MSAPGVDFLFRWEPIAVLHTQSPLSGSIGTFRGKVRSPPMPTYKALIFDMNRLIRWEAVEAADDLSAVNAIPTCREAGRIEIWRGSTRLATIKCADPRLHLKL